jgi:hypothetical protein
MTTAKKTKVQTYVLEAGRRFVAISATTPGTAYEIIRHSEQPGDISCGCPGFTYRRTCKHVRAVEAQWAAARDAEWRADLAAKISDLYN